MSNNDTWRPQWADIPAAIGLLSRIPVRVDEAWAKERGPQQCWAFGLVGLVLGLVSSICAWIGLALDLNPLAVGILIVASVTFVSGAMHQDGLADTLDGFWGGWTRMQRLEIMKDSHIGAYGVLGLVIVVGLQAALYGQLIQKTILPIIGIMVMSRAVMVPVMAILPNARGSGLSSQIGRPKIVTAWLAMGLGSILAIVTGAWAAILGASIAAIIVALIANQKIKGQTGDILGATQQTAELTSLLFVVALS